MQDEQKEEEDGYTPDDKKFVPVIEYVIYSGPCIISLIAIVVCVT